MLGFWNSMDGLTQKTMKYQKLLKLQ